MDKPSSNTLIEGNPLKRRLLFAAGHVCVLLGLLALLLPVIPTSPFLIVGAACYARSSEKFYNLLLQNKYCGPMIRQWERNRCIEKKFKLAALAVLAVAFASSSFLFLEGWPARALLMTFGLAAMVFVVSIPTCPDAARSGPGRSHDR